MKSVIAMATNDRSHLVVRLPRRQERMEYIGCPFICLCQLVLRTETHTECHLQVDGAAASSRSYGLPLIVSISRVKGRQFSSRQILANAVGLQRVASSMLVQRMRWRECAVRERTVRPLTFSPSSRRSWYCECASFFLPGT
jgi:hypothetical protein